MYHPTMWDYGVKIVVGDDNRIYQMIYGEWPIQTAAHDSNRPLWMQFTLLPNCKYEGDAGHELRDPGIGKIDA